MNQDLSRTLATYCIGFGLSLMLSLGAYFIVISSVEITQTVAMALLLSLATVQLLVQLYCFLHLKANRASRSRIAIFSFTTAMMLIIVIGSIWIMRNLDYRMGMPPDAMNDYMQMQNKKGF